DRDLRPLPSSPTRRSSDLSCVACHQIDKKSIGPAYKDVAAKYKGDAAAPARLADHVKNGSVGVWGQMPMPANSQVPDEDVKKLRSEEHTSELQSRENLVCR